jgi:hypothetical protein
VLGWRSAAPEKAAVDGKEIPCVSAVVDGTLLLQVLGKVEGERAKVVVDR